MLMQQVLALCLQGFMAMGPQMATMILNHVFSTKVCLKVWNPLDIANMWEDVAITLALLEK
jgi:hypothetical protein